MTPVARRLSPSPVDRTCSPWSLGSLALLLYVAASAAAQGVRPTPLAQQANGFVAELPAAAPYSQLSGLRLEVDTCWPFNYGYRPIRVRVTAAKPTTIEHRITIRFNISAWDRHYLDVSESFDMPLGATEASATIRCPQLQSNYRYGWGVWVDGERDRELCVEEADSWNFTVSGNANPAGSSLKFLVVGPAAGSQRGFGPGNDPFDATMISLQDLPMQWLDYTAIDVVALEPADLDELSRSRPEAVTALGRWVRSGGQLWVHSVGRHWGALGMVEHRLGLSADGGTADDSNHESDEAVAGRGWKPVPFGGNSRLPRVTVQHIPSGTVRVIRNPQVIDRLKRDPDYIVTDDPTPEPTRAPQEGGGAADSANWYVDRTVGLGRVRAFRREWDPIGFSYSWQMLGGWRAAPPNLLTPLSATLETTRNWQSRHGLAPDLANEDFANLLVPGVGLAPVTEFRVLITVFVLAIGPLNYWVLVRANRLHLMLLTVPLMALGLTAGLFGYALVSDGLSTSVRVRSYTTLDQTTGEAACWARLSYYSGLAPGGGLTLSDDTAIYPILPGWNEIGDSTAFDDTRRIVWGNDRQRLAAGWLRSRVPMQYLTVRARKSPHRLRLAPGTDELTATNELGTPIKFVAVVDRGGRVFTGDSIVDRATASLKPSIPAEALRQLRALISENEPEPPPALAEDENGFPRSQRRRQRRLQQRYGLEYCAERLSENLASEAIAALVATSDESVLNLPPKSYVAITETGPEVELGIPDVTEQASFHVLVGQW